jgi:hypothetical protein
MLRTAEAGPCYGFFMNLLLWGMRNARVEAAPEAHLPPLPDHDEPDAPDTVRRAA